MNIFRVWQNLCRLERTLLTMATKADLDAIIASLPDLIAKAVEDGLAPVIEAIVAKTKANASLVDLTDEVTALQAIPQAVADAVSGAVANPSGDQAPTA